MGEFKSLKKPFKLALFPCQSFSMSKLFPVIADGAIKRWANQGRVCGCYISSHKLALFPCQSFSLSLLTERFCNGTFAPLPEVVDDPQVKSQVFNYINIILI